MGAYLNKPITEKESESGEGNGLKYGATSMQGWRVNQEDAHNCVIGLHGTWSMFAVYDGHGGTEVSRYVSLHLPDFLKSREFWAAEDIVTALQNIFIDFDDVLRSEVVLNELKKMSKESEEKPTRDHDDSDDENDRIQTIEESALPLEELLAKYGYTFLQKGGAKNLVQSVVDVANVELNQGDIAEKEKKGKRVSKSPALDTVKRAKTDADEESLEGNEINTNDTKGNDNGEDTETVVQDTSEGSSDSKGDAVIIDDKDEEKTNNLKMKNKVKKVAVASDKKDDSDVTECDDESDDSDFDEDEAADEEESEDEDEGQEILLPGGETPGEDSGTTACLCLLNNEKIVVANAGDSRAVLCREGKALDLSIDHKPEDEVEKMRIEKAGGMVNGDGRVNGGLNLSRALGDHSYKKNEDLPLRDQMITALPDVKVELIQPGDEFIVVACDGIWNSMESQQVIDFVRERISKGKSCEEISGELCDHCLAESTAGDGTGCDNMTVIVAQITH